MSKWLFLIFGFFQFSVWADVPYDSLEKIRQFTVVTQVGVETGDKLKTCSDYKRRGEFTDQLAKAYEEESIVWDNAIITTADLKLLKQRALNCRARGSCEVYSRFLAKAVKDQASAAEVEKLQKEVTEIFKKMNSEDYRQALTKIPGTCAILADLLSY